ncbi:MAG: hypothetical protein M0Q42_05290 [Xanthomonadales bacterium]|nr:hypothetical protein [Xanthomonadales bacterium]
MPEAEITTRLFIASTPTMALACAGAALAQGGRSELVLIEDFAGARQLQALLAGWRDLPFQAMHRLPGRRLEQRAAGRGNLRLACKRRLRQKTLPALRRLDARLRPDQVWLGNDRKPETQLALYLASRRLGRRTGQYLDDGLYSYLGDVRRRPLSRRIDTLAKWLTYGHWWQRADHAGGSRWMARHWLALPARAPAYPAASRSPLPRHWYDNRPMRRLALAALRQFGLARRHLQVVDHVLVLPCSDRWPDAGHWHRRLDEALRALRRPGRRLAVKFHPRESRANLIDDIDLTVLPSLLPLELLLPVLPAHARLLGEGTSALLGAHWLRPELAISMLALSDGRPGPGGGAALAPLGAPVDPYSRRATELFASQGIGRSPALSPLAVGAAPPMPIPMPAGRVAAAGTGC